MIKTAAQILAEIRKSKTEYGKPLTAFDAQVIQRASRGVGRPRLYRRCSATEKGICFEPVNTYGMCWSHGVRMQKYGNPYAGRPIRHAKQACKHCDKRTYIRFKHIGGSGGTRHRVVDDHKMRNGKICPGSGYAPVRDRREWTSAKRATRKNG